MLGVLNLIFMCFVQLKFLVLTTLSVADSADTGTDIFLKKILFAYHLLHIFGYGNLEIIINKLRRFIKDV